MTENLNEVEEVVFGGAIDLGSKVKKTEEYAGVGVKYCSVASKSLENSFEEMACPYHCFPGGHWPVQ